MKPYDDGVGGANDRLLGAIRRGMEVMDPLPDGMVERIKFVMTVRALEADVAVLTSPLAGESVRMTEYERAGTVTFESAGVSIMVTIEAGDNRRGSSRLHGWVTIPHAEIELRERARSQTVLADAEGRFAFDSVESGTVHLLVRTADPRVRPVITPGIEI